MSLSEITLTDNYYTFVCPHCDDMIIVHKDDVNCDIFRHGQFKTDGSTINPHAPKQYCIDIIIYRSLIIIFYFFTYFLNTKLEIPAPSINTIEIIAR